MRNYIQNFLIAKALIVKQQKNGSPSRWFCFGKNSLIFILCTLSLFFASSIAYSKQIDSQKELTVKLADLIKDWPQYRNLVVTTRGRLHCLDTTHCDFLPTVGLRRTLFVLVQALDKDTRQRLFMGCFQNDCLVEVRGEVGDWELYAWEIWQAP